MFATLGYYICVPFAFLTRLFYSWTGSYGVALILFTLVVKLVLLPFQLKSKKSMLRMNRMQGKLNDIKTRYANNQQKQQEAMAELYAKEGINPMSGCLWSFIPFPILIALYYIIRVPMRYFMGLSETVIAEITTLAGSLGFTVADGSQAYEQIYLAKFIHEHWAEFATSSTVKTDFMRKWNHNRSGKPISLDEMMENEDGDIFEVADPRGEFEQNVISEMQITAFAERSISEKDREILKLRMDGLTEQEIADKVGYKTASAVHKRIAKIAGAYEDYVTAEYQKYLDK